METQLLDLLCKKTKFIQKISDPLPPKFYASKKTAIAKKKVGVPRSLTLTQWVLIFSDVGEKSHKIFSKVQITVNKAFHMEN